MLIAVLLVGPLLSVIPIIVWVFRRRTRASLEALQVHAFVLAAYLVVSCIVDLSRGPTGVDLSGAFQLCLILAIVADLAVYVAVAWRTRIRGEGGSPEPERVSHADGNGHCHRRDHVHGGRSARPRTRRRGREGGPPASSRTTGPSIRTPSPCPTWSREREISCNGAFWPP